MYTIKPVWSYARGGNRYELRAPNGQFRGHYGYRDDAEEWATFLASYSELIFQLKRREVIEEALASVKKVWV